MTDRDHRFRRRMAVFVGLVAAALAAYATYLAVTLPAGLHFPVGFSRPGRQREIEMGVEGLYLFPAVLAVGAGYLWRSEAWLLPGPGKERRFTLGLIWMLVIGVAVAQLVICAEAVGAAGVA